MLSVVKTAVWYFRCGQVPILSSIQYVTFNYGDFQKASRISLVSPLYLLTLFNYLTIRGETGAAAGKGLHVLHRVH